MAYRLYQMADSGNCYKVRLLMSQLELPLETIDIDITKGESRTEEFLRINPNGKVPTLFPRLWLCSGLASSNTVTNPTSQRHAIG